MNKLIKTISIAVGLIFIFISCENGDTIEVIEENNLIAVITLWQHPYSQEFIFDGNIITTEISELEYIVLNMDTVFYSEPSNYYYNDYKGNIDFNLNYYEYHIPTSNTVMLEIHTGAGFVRGFGTVPDSLRNITFNYTDSVKIGENLVLTYLGNADYYNIYYQYKFLSNDSTSINYKIGNIYTIENEAHIDSTLLNKNGYLKIYSIRAVNGPLPEPKSKANMDGDGKGFLFIIGGQELDREFVIGEGYQFP